MKTLGKTMLFAAGLLLLFSCSKLDQTEFGMNGLSGHNSKGSAILQEGLFVVEPNGIDETTALKEAFDQAIDFGPEAVVQLTAGEFHLNFMEIREFHGTFKGEGKGTTVITPIDGLDIAPLTSQLLNTFLIKFVGGEVCLSDMTIKTPPGVLTTDPDEWWIEGLVNFSARTRQYTSREDYINVNVNNIEFIAGNEPVSGWRSNCNQAVMAGFDSRYVQIPGGWPLSPTDITITNCSFDNFDIYGVLIAYINKGKIVAGTRNNPNKFYNNSTYAYGYGGSLAFWHNNDLDVSITGNNFTDPGGARFGVEATSAPWPEFLSQVTQTKPSVFNIGQNEFNIIGGTGGVLVNDQRRVIYSDAVPMVVQVHNNRFSMSEGAFTGIGCFNMNGMVIRNNLFKGSASYGVRIMRVGMVLNENGLLLGNNFSNSEYSVTTILLNPGSTNWTIVGGDLGESITNLGTDNLITGFNVNTSEEPFGQTIVDNLGQMRAVIKELKGH